MRTTPEQRILSQSALQDYLDCPRRYLLRHVQQLDFPSVESEPTLENELHQKEGQDFHRKVEQFWLGMPRESLSSNLESARMQLWWGNFLATDFELEGFQRHPEFTLSAPLGDFRLIAKYDLVAYLPRQRVLIFDWKTYGTLPKPDWLLHRMQTRVYRAVMVMAGTSVFGGHTLAPDQVELVYWFAEHPDATVRLPYDGNQFKSDWQLLQQLADEIAGAVEFPMTTHTERCGLCVYRSYCERGGRAALGETEQEPSRDSDGEAGLEETVGLGL